MSGKEMGGDLLQHVVALVCNSGAIMQWMADVTEHAHVTEIKQPAHAGNNQDYYAQIAWHLDHSEKCFWFDLTTHLASAEQGESSKDNEDQEDEHEPDLEAHHISHNYTLSHTSINYFESAKVLASGEVPNSTTEKVQIWFKVWVQQPSYHD
ncbi:hypothetical protein F5141DRAFT_1060042 [Pisolithus sp. B1]|nr:hypothetical protein F5141DRAFT_1060042 [Pisolithus sp. B1]